MEKLYVKNNGNGWFACCKGKDKEGKACCGYLNVGFRKGEEPLNNPAIIEVLDSFHTSYPKKNGKEGEGVVKYFIKSYNLVEFKSENKKNPQESQMMGNPTPTVNGEELDLPWYGG